MPYHFKRSDESVQHGLRRIAIEEIDKAIDELDDHDVTRDVRVHQVRKRCKKTRALIQLVRPVFADYPVENAALRDSARQLAFARDASVAITTYDSLMETYRDEVARTDFAAIRRQLTLQQKRDANPARIDDAFVRVRSALNAVRSRARHWQLAEDGFAGIVGGLAKDYSRARKTMARAARDGNSQAFHEWRKRVKIHGYHTRLTAPLWSGPMKARRKSADSLGDLLGLHHDLAAFQATLAAAPDAFVAHHIVEAIIGLARRRQQALAAEAFPLGARLTAERKGSLKARWQAYWAVWCDEQPRGKAALAA